MVSTDYDADPPDTAGHTAYGAPVHIFSPAEIEELIKHADKAGFDLDGSFSPDHPQRPVYWKRVGLRLHLRAHHLYPPRAMTVEPL